MDTLLELMPPHQRALTDRFRAACQADRRILAAFLGGSYARGTADAFSDLDLYLVTSDEDFEQFNAVRREFVGQLGELLFLEDFDIPGYLFFVFSDGVEGELGIACQSELARLHSGSYHVLVDKHSLLAGDVFPPRVEPQGEQVEKLRRLVCWFWHEMSHFTTAMGRGDLWWAYGQLEMMRRYCLNLARLSTDFSDPEVGEEGYFKIDTAVSAGLLSPLRSAYCPMEAGAMLQAAQVVLRYYQDLAPRLALTHGIPYPAELEGLLTTRLAKISVLPSGEAL